MDIIKCACAFLMELELILIESRCFKLRHAFCIVGYGVFSYSFLWMFLKLCKHIVNIHVLNMCIWVF